MGVDFARHVVTVLEQLLFSRVSAGARVLDLCCGTGRVTAVLSARGYRVLGIDTSEPMLRLARLNDSQAWFVRADARHITLAPVFAAAVSTFNSLAHLRTFDDLVAAARNVRAALIEGAVWVFDLSSETAYAERWRGWYVLRDADAECVIKTSYDASTRLARNEITIYEGGWTGGNARAEFTILQKCHADKEVRAALAAAPFRTVESFDAEDDLGMRGERGQRFFVAH